MVSSRYQKKLNRQITQYGILTVFICFTGFFATLIAYTGFYNSYLSYRYSAQLEASFNRVVGGYEGYLRDGDQQRTMLDFLDGAISENHLSYLFHDALRDIPVGADLILRDAAGKVRFTTFSERERTRHLLYFDEIVQADHAKGRSREIYRTVYYIGGEFSRYLLVESLYDGDGTYRGGAALYLDGQEWNSQLNSNHYTSVITGQGGRVIASSNRSMVDGMNRFLPVQGRRITLGGQSYWLHGRTLPREGASVYAFVYSPPAGGYLMTGCVVIAGILLLTIALCRRFSSNVANINSASLTALRDEIAVIKEGRVDHRIKLRSDDEFEAIAAQITAMLDNIEALSSRNLELLRQSTEMEMRQLEAQFNPHFLYNTLESIRYSIKLDPQAADRIILKLTGLLRYSIRDSQHLVRAEEDFYMLRDYLEILCYRFQNRLSYHMEIAPECLGYPIPKLLLQPVIENSMKYGFLSRREIRIGICGWVEEGYLYFRVTDDGRGMDEEQLQAVRRQLGEDGGEHKGLHHIARRLQLQYGAESGISIQSERGSGTQVTLKIRCGEGWQSNEL